MYFFSGNIRSDHIIVFMSDEWIRNTLYSVSIILLLLIGSRYLKKTQNIYITYFMGIILFLTSIQLIYVIDKFI